MKPILTLSVFVILLVIAMRAYSVAQVEELPQPQEVGGT
jgi:hypothetical protein